MSRRASKIFWVIVERLAQIANGAKLTVESGGELDVESGGSLKIAGTAISATAAEVNKLAGVTAGTATASKAAVLGTNKNLDTLVLADGGLKLGSGAGTAVTAKAAEINKLDGAPLAATMVVGAEGANVINVAIQLQDGAGADLAVRGTVLAYLANDANGDAICTTAPNGGVAIGTDGLLVPVPQVLQNALLVDGNLAISATAEKFKTTQTLAALLNGILATKAATDNLVFSAAHVITASKFGCILIQMNSAGTISTKVAASPQAYDNAPAALAALPSADAGNIAIGYIAIEAGLADWTANTDDLTNGSDLTTAAFNDSSESTLSLVPKMFQLVSESDGDIDVNITDTGTPTFYLVLALPNGLMAVSGAITFA